MPINVPSGVPAVGKVSMALVPIASLTNRNAPSAAIINGAAALNFSCHVLGDGYSRTPEQARAERRRICSATTYDVLGPRKVNFDAIRAVYDPQKPTDAVSKLYAMAVEGTEFYLVERLGKDGQSDFATGDLVDVYRIKIGVKHKLIPGDEGEFEFTFEVTNLDTPTTDVLLVA